MTSTKPAPAATVLVVDDEPIIRDTLAEFLGQEGFAVTACGTGEEAVKLVQKSRFDVVLCDVNLPGLDGLDVLDRVARLSPETFVLLITAYATVDSAVEAFQKGAHDYLMKPVLLPEVSGKVRRLLRQRDLHRENQWLRRELNRDDTGGLVVGSAPAMKAALELVRRAAPTPTPLLLLGESGTGKELMARAVHRFAQAAKPTGGRFVAADCAALPADELEAALTADGGANTVFLDEVGELPLGTQARLLRAMEHSEATGRVVAATNKELAKEAEAGRFRDDLFYRLNVVSVRLPPLRERREDIPELAEALLAKHARAMGKRVSGVSREAMQVLLARPWKGNVRELDNVLQRAVILGDGPLVTVADLPPDLVPSPGDPFAVDELGAAVERFEKLHIERMLRLVPDKREAAKRLGIGLSSLYRKIEQYGISI